MNKLDSKISFILFFRNFIHDKVSISICCLSLIILFISYLVYFQKEPHYIFPNNENIQIEFYDDSAENGNSVIDNFILSDSIISIDFTLKKGFVRPYVGIGLILIDEEEFDISDYNEVQIEVQGNGIKNIEVYLIQNDSSNIATNGSLSLLYYRENIELKSGKRIYNSNINNFHLPDWWFDINNYSPSEIEKIDCKSLARINISPGLTPALDISKTLNIYSISFIKNNTRTIIYLLIIQFGIVLLVLILRNTPFNKIFTVTINYKAVVIDDKVESANSFLDYINNNFYDNELSLLKVAENTGVNPRVITDSISNNFNCNFKTYINQIRINESKRLLKETDLRINEIAYKVGFNSPNHFNRVFKKTIGENPSEFLEKL